MERGTYFDFCEVRTGIYAAIVHDGAGALGNSGIVDLGDRTLVFDTTQSIPAAEELKSVARKLTGNNVSLIVNSHRHNDHVLGNQVFADSTIISTQITRSVMANRLPSFLAYAKAHPEYPNQIRSRLLDPSLSDQGRWEVERDLGDTEHLAAHLAEYVPTLPNVCFEEQMYVYGPDRQAHLFTYGGGHSPSDACMYLPEEKVLFAGDLVFVGYHPSMADGNPEQWITILGSILELDFETVIAGHGPLGNRSHVEQTKRYLETLIELVMSGPETLNLDGIPPEYREWRGESVYLGNLKSLNQRYGRS